MRVTRSEFEALVMVLAKDMSVAAIARLVEEHDTRLWRIVHHHVEEGRAAADFSEVRSVGVDAKASRRGHYYITLFVPARRLAPRDARSPVLARQGTGA